MPKVKAITQLELDGFADLLQDAEDGGQEGRPLTMAEVRERELAARIVLGDMVDAQDAPSWAEQYNDLMLSNVPWRVAAFVAWSTVPKHRRWPKTQEELAVEVLGLTSDRRITEWRRKYPYIDQMIASLQTAALLDYIPGAIVASGEVASEPSYRSTAERRLFFEATGIIENKSKVTVEEPGLVSAGRKMLDRLRKMTTDKKVELLGEEAEEFMRELEEEFEQEDEEYEQTPLPSLDPPSVPHPPAPEGASPQIEEHDLGGDSEEDDES